MLYSNKLWIKKGHKGLKLKSDPCAENVGIFLYKNEENKMHAPHHPMPAPVNQQYTIRQHPTKHIQVENAHYKGGTTRDRNIRRPYNE